MPLLPINKPQDLVTFDLLIDGKPIPQTVQVYSIDIWHELNRIPRAKVIIIDGDPSKETFAQSESNLFNPGTEVEILAGFHSDNTSIFKGIITAQSIRVRAGGRNTLMIDCSDRAVAMTNIPRSRYFYDMTESKMFQDIIGQYQGLKSTVERTDYRHGELLQFQSTDWDFMMTRAEVNGMFCIVDGGSVQIETPNFNKAPVHEIIFGRNLLEMDAEMDAETQLPNVKATSWDYSKSMIARTESSLRDAAVPGDISSSELAEVYQSNEWILQNGGKIPEELLYHWVNAKRMRHELAKVRGRVRITGKALMPGSIVTLLGLGDRFNGNAFVSGVKHSIANGDWVTDIQYGLSPKSFAERFNLSRPSAQGMTPSVGGLQIGLVTAIEGDPEKDERILVRLPLVGEQETGLWARLSTRGAGNNRGLVFRPEIGDEVIVGFVNEDPNQPIILGSLHSSANSSPIVAKDENHQKGWLTRGKIKLMIDDDLPEVRVEMPSGRKVVLNDNDGEIVLNDPNGNSLVMNSDGIDLQSGNDISISASGNVSVRGTNVSVDANANLKTSGGSGATLEAGGQTVVKGAIVSIN